MTHQVVLIVGGGNIPKLTWTPRVAVIVVAVVVDVMVAKLIVGNTH